MTKARLKKLAKIAEYEYLESQWEDIQRILFSKDNDMSLSNIIGLKIGIMPKFQTFTMPEMCLVEICSNEQGE